LTIFVRWLEQSNGDLLLLAYFVEDINIRFETGRFVNKSELYPFAQYMCSWAPRHNEAGLLGQLLWFCNTINGCKWKEHISFSEVFADKVGIPESWPTSTPIDTYRLIDTASPCWLVGRSKTGSFRAFELKENIVNLMTSFIDKDKEMQFRVAINDESRFEDEFYWEIQELFASGRGAFDQPQAEFWKLYEPTEL
jgi:hypothetical protein